MGLLWDFKNDVIHFNFEKIVAKAQEVPLTKVLSLSAWKCCSKNDWVLDLSRIKGIVISRCIYNSLQQEVLECNLHGFGDASNKAYCTVVYFVYWTWDGVHMRLLTSRSRVAPLKELTIPRLELMSARILAQLMSTVKNALEEQVTLNGTRY